MINSDLYISLMKLNEICEVYSGYAIKEFNNIKKGLPVIKIGNILTDGTLNLGECQFSTEDINEKYHSKKGDIYVALSGATTGKLGIMEDEKKYIINQRVGIIRLKQKSVSQSYIKFFLLKQTERIIDEATGCAQPNISPKQIGEYDVPVFPEKEMLQISDILNNIVCVIKHYKAMIKKYDDLIKARFIEMFGDPVADTKNWGQTLLKEHLESIRYGTSTPPIFTDDGYAFIRATNIKNGKIVTNDMKYIPQEEADRLEKCKLSGGEIIIVRSGVNAGDTCVVTDEYIGQYAGYDMILVLSSDLHPVFFNTLINTEYMDKVVKPLTRRAAQPHLNSEQTQRLPIIEVPFELQEQFADFVKQVDKSREAVKKSLEKTKQLYDSLMQEYFG